MIRPMKIWKSLLRRKLRTFFAVLGVAIGIAAVVSLRSAAKGFKAQFQRITELYQSQIIVVDKTASSPIFSFIAESTLADIAKIDGVSTVSGNLLTFSRLPNQPMFLVIGLDPGGDLFKQVRILEGKGLVGGGPGEALLGQRAAESMGIGLGATVPIRGRNYRIVGIYTQKTNITDSGVIVRLSDLQELTNQKERVTLAAVSVSDKNWTVAEIREGRTQAEMLEIRTQAVIREIEKRFPSLSANRAETLVDQYTQLEMIDTFALAISFLAALVGGVGVMNTMMMSVFERTREIGVLRAIGWSGRRVLAMVVVEGALLSFFGGIIGIGLGIAMLETIVRVMSTTVTWVDSTYPPRLMAEALALALGLGIFGSLLPGWKASRLDPIEALRYE